MSAPTDFPDRAPAGYAWAIAQIVSGPSYHSGSLLTRPELGRFYLHSEARKSIKARADAHNTTLVPVLIEDARSAIANATGSSHG